jgi:hypothetical protein
VTAAAIARELGIDGRAITGAELAALSDDDLKQQIDGIGVIARVTPEDKVRLVDILKQKSNVVALHLFSGRGPGNGGREPELGAPRCPPGHDMTGPAHSVTGRARSGYRPGRGRRGEDVSRRRGVADDEAARAIARPVPEPTEPEQADRASGRPRQHLRLAGPTGWQRQHDVQTCRHPDRAQRRHPRRQCGQQRVASPPASAPAGSCPGPAAPDGSRSGGSATPSLRPARGATTVPSPCRAVR